MKRTACIVILVALVGCSPTTEQAGEEDPPATRPPAVVETAGLYDLVSTVDITASALTPEMIYRYYDILRLFQEDPAEALFLVLSEAGVPLVDELVAALPSALEDRLKGWINDYVRERVLAGPLGPAIQDIVELGETAVTHVELVSELDLPEGAEEGVIAEHRLLALRFHLAGQTIDVPIPADAPAPLAFDVTVEAHVQAGVLTLGDHAFGVEMGKLAWQALQAAIQARYGDDIRGTLGRAVDCPALAASVASHCLLTVCVGHADQLEAICEAGLDEAVNRLQARVEEISFDAVHFADGSADLIVDADGGVERLDGGVWSCEIDLGQGPRLVPATFEGVASPEA